MYEVGMNQIDWGKAPKDATHYLESKDRPYPYWIKVGDGSYHYCSVKHLEDWAIDIRDFLQVYDNGEWTIIPRPQIQPKKGEHKMFTAKQLKDTYPHKQMRVYIEEEVADVAKRPAALGQLVKKFLYNCQEAGTMNVPEDVDAAFIWGNTEEGHDFWLSVNLMRPAKPAPVKKVPVAEPKLVHKLQVGWW